MSLPAPSPVPASRPVLVPALLLTTTGLLILLQWTTFERIKTALISDPSLSALRLSTASLGRTVTAVLTPSDIALVLSLLACAVVGVLAEWRTRRVTLEVQTFLRSDRSTAVLLGLGTLVAARFHLAPGDFALGDSLAHVTRIDLTERSLRAGAYPDWSFQQFAGTPLLQFYSPLFFLLAGALAAAFGSIVWATKLLLLACHVGAAIGVFAWLRSAGCARGAASVGGGAAALTFQFTHAVTWAGQLPVALAYALVPLVLVSVEAIRRRPSARAVAMLAVSGTALVWTHHGHAAFALQLVALYAVARLLSVGDPSARRRSALALGIGFAAALAGALGFLVPLRVEGTWVFQPSEWPLLAPRWPSADHLRRVLVWSNRWSGFGGAYIGLSILGLAGFGLLRGRGALRVALAIPAAAALACAEQAGGRVGFWALPFLAALTTQGLRSPRAVGIAGLLLCLDLGATTLQSPYRSDRAFLREGLEAIAREVHPARLACGYSNGRGESEYFEFYDQPGVEWQHLVGSYPQGAPRTLDPALALVDELNAPGDSLSAWGRDLAHLMFVGGCVTAGRDRILSPAKPPPSEDISLAGTPAERPWLRVGHAAPLVFAPRIDVVTDDTLRALRERDLLFDRERATARPEYSRRLAGYIGRMGLDRRRSSAARLFTFASPGDVSDPSAGDTIRQEVELRLLRHEAGLRRVDLEYEITRAGWLQLAYAHYPTLRVRLDGRLVQPLPSLTGTMLLVTPAGRHRIELVPSTAPIRAWTPWLGAAAALGLLGLARRLLRPRTGRDFECGPVSG